MKSSIRRRRTNLFFLYLLMLCLWLLFSALVNTAVFIIHKHYSVLALRP